MGAVAVQRLAKGSRTASQSIGAGDGWVAPTPGNLLVFSANSDATVTTAVSGVTAGPTIVDGNGTYTWWKFATGSETTITMTPSSLDDIVITACEYAGVLSFATQATSTIAGAPGGISISAVTFNPAAAGGLVLGWGMLHTANATTANPNAPVWTDGLTNVLTSFSQVTPFTSSTQACHTFMGELLSGTAGSQNTAVSWEASLGYSDRQGLVLVFNTGGDVPSFVPSMWQVPPSFALFGPQGMVPDPAAWPDGTAGAAPSAVTLIEATGAWSAVAMAAVTPQPVALTLTPAASSWSAVVVALTPGQVATTIVPASAAWSAVVVSPVPQPVAVTLTPATASWTAVTVTALPGMTLSPATAVWAAVAVSPIPGQVALTLTPASATWSAVSVGVVSQVALTRATASWSAVPVAPVPQPVALTLAPATASWSALVVALTTPGALSVIQATAAWSAVAVTPTPGQVAVTLTPSVAHWSAVALTATPAVSLVASTAVWSARPVTLTPGVVALNLAPAGSTWTAVSLSPAGASLVTVAQAIAAWVAIAVSPAGAGAPGVVRGSTGRAGTVAPSTSAGHGAYRTTDARIGSTIEKAGTVNADVV